MSRRKIRDVLSHGDEDRFVDYQERIGPFPRRSIEGHLQVAGIGVTRVAVLWNPDNPVWPPALKRGERLLQQLKLLQFQFVAEDCKTGDIAAGPCQTRDQTRLDRVAAVADDRDRARGLLGGDERWRCPGDEYWTAPTFPEAPDLERMGPCRSRRGFRRKCGRGRCGWWWNMK